MAGLGINIGYLLMQLLIMVILYNVLSHFLWTPITNSLEARKARIAKGLEDARQAAIARDNADAEAKKVLDAARAEAAGIRKEASVQAEGTARGIKEQAQEEAKTILANARVEAEGERNRILAELRGQVAAISIAAANKLVGEALDDARQRALLADFFAKVPGNVSTLSGKKAVITSALPLTADEQAKVKATVKAESYDFKVDPKILGGLIVRVDDQVVDSSVASQMATLGESLR